MRKNVFCGIVLAGGRSNRMGSDKALLSSGKETFLQETVEKFRRRTDNILISASGKNRYREWGYPVVADRYTGSGALAGIEAGLTAASVETCFFLPVDMPFVPLTLIDAVIDMSRGYDGAVPYYEGLYEPLCAVYRKSCLPAIRQCLEQDERRVRSFYPLVNIRKICREELQKHGSVEQMFLNVNTGQDYIDYLKINKGEKHD